MPPLVLNRNKYVPFERVGKLHGKWNVVTTLLPSHLSNLIAIWALGHQVWSCELNTQSHVIGTLWDPTTWNLIGYWNRAPQFSLSSSHYVQANSTLVYMTSFQYTLLPRISCCDGCSSTMVYEHHPFLFHRHSSSIFLVRYCDFLLYPVPSLITLVERLPQHGVIFQLADLLWNGKGLTQSFADGTKLRVETKYIFLHYTTVYPKRSLWYHDNTATWKRFSHYSMVLYEGDHRSQRPALMTSFDASLLKVWSNSRIVKLPMIVNVIMLVWRHFHDCPPAFIRHRYDCIDFKLLSYRFVRTTKK